MKIDSVSQSKGNVSRWPQSSAFGSGGKLGKKLMKSVFGAILFSGALLSPISAFATDSPTSIVIDLYPEGKLQPLPSPEIREDPLGTGQFNIRNVSVPTLEMFAPAEGKANGTAIIVAPGGGFFTLVYDNEGTAVAKRLAQQGITAFVLKYRLMQTPPALAGAPPQHQKEMAIIMARAMTGIPTEVPRFPAEAAAWQDAARAVQILREKSADLHIDSKQIGFLGFSAGAFLAVDVAIGDKETRPNFIGVIYGALRTPVPSDAPPAFIATAANDEAVPNDPLQLFSGWRAAGRPAELHIFGSGGHGFGMSTRDATSDHWFDEFIWWVRSHQLVPEPEK